MKPTKKRRNLFIALFATLVILIGVAVVAILMDRKLKDPDGVVKVEGFDLVDEGKDEAALEWFSAEAEALEAKNKGDEPDRLGARFGFEAARIAERLEKTEEAKSLIATSWERGYRTRYSCELMVRTHLDGIEGQEFYDRSMELFNLLPEDEQNQELLGDLNFRGDRKDEALEIWMAHANETHETSTLRKLAGVLVRDDRGDEAWEFVNNLRDGGKGLDEGGYILLALLASTQSMEELGEISAEAKSAGRAGMRYRLQHALLRLSMNELRAATELLETCSASRIRTSDWEAELVTNARLILGYLYLSKGEKRALRDLAEVDEEAPKTAMSEGEAMWYEVLRGDPARPIDVRELKQILRVTGGNNPAVRLLLGQTYAKNGDPEAALEQFSSIDGVLRQWLPVALGFAAAHIQMGNDMEAAQVLDRIHSAGFKTDESEAIANSIAVSNGLVLPEGEEFVKFKPVVDAMMAGKIDLVDGLLEEHLATPFGARLAVQAQLLRGNEEAAMQSMEGLSTELKDWMILATVAERQDSLQAAELAYTKALDLSPNDPVLINNWANVMMNAESFSANADEVLAVCRKLHSEYPENPVITDTLADCLIRTGRLDESDELLGANATPFQLLRLAKAYGEAGDEDKEQQSLKRCQEAQASLEEWRLPISRSELENLIANRDQ